METESDERIRVRAYHLGEADGSPPGREEEYWHRAAANQRADLASAETLPASDPPAYIGSVGPVT